jgi:hypothetical protein
MKRSVVVFLTSVLCGCATQQPTTTPASARQAETTQQTERAQPPPAPDAGYAERLDTLARDPKMINYIGEEICKKPQPQRAEVANELIRTHHIEVTHAFEPDHPANLEGAGQVLAIPIPCP